MPDTPDVKAAIGRLSTRMDHMSERQDAHGERTEEGLQRVNDRLDRIISDLEAGRVERHDIADQLRDVKARLEVVEGGQTDTAVGAAVYAGTLAKTEARKGMADAVREGQSNFWSTTTGRIVKWATGFSAFVIAAGQIPNVLRWLEQAWTFITRTPAP